MSSRLTGPTFVLLLMLPYSAGAKPPPNLLFPHARSALIPEGKNDFSVQADK